MIFTDTIVLSKGSEFFFEFYLLEKAKQLMEEKGISNPSHAISGEELKRLLEPLKVSAGKAVELYGQNIPVGHTVHLFRGVK